MGIVYKYGRGTLMKKVWVVFDYYNFYDDWNMEDIKVKEMIAVFDTKEAAMDYKGEHNDFIIEGIEVSTMGQLKRV